MGRSTTQIMGFLPPEVSFPQQRHNLSCFVASCACSTFAGISGTWECGEVDRSALMPSPPPDPQPVTFLAL